MPDDDVDNDVVKVERHVPHGKVQGADEHEEGGQTHASPVNILHQTFHVKLRPNSI